MTALVLRLAGGRARKWPLRHRFVVVALLVICATALGTASAKVAGQVRAPPPDNTSPPTISGDAVEGETLTGTNGTWEGDELSFTRSWQRSDGLGGYDDIPGATATTYTLTSDDVGHTIRLSVTASNTNHSETAFSDPTDTVAAAPPEPPDNIVPPTISGNAVEGQTLSSTDGSWDGEELTFERRWQRADGLGGYVDIPGATTTTYTLTTEDVGHPIRLRVTASNTGGTETASSAPTDPVVAAQNVQRSLGLFVPQRPRAYRRATIRVQGIAVPPLRLWVYENLRGKACPATPSERKRRSRTLIAGLPVDGDFNEQRRPRMKKPGRHAYCAYLGPDAYTATITSFATRKIRKPLLRAGRARGTVVTALRRHNFADRVVANLEQSCRRRSRSEFECRFSSAFPGYRLTARGSVELKRKVSYRFQVSVHGRSLVLTDENEGSFPG